ncbi:hypothetical protein WBP06_00560 [Novosphingobium sp. BL-8H]|uniref:hypothetical protein n=1 Tax=Novosphingobium sp. BL-8H TaxID=3127640 RepID=UPI0037569ED4
MNDIRLSVATLVDISPLEFGENFFRKIIDKDCRFAPKTLSIDPMKYQYDGVKSIEREWLRESEIPDDADPGKTRKIRSSFHWQGNEDPVKFGSVNFPKKNDYGEVGNGLISIRANYAESELWVSLFKKICSLSSPFWGFVHVIADEETYIDTAGSRVDRYCKPVTTKAYRTREFPNLASLNFIRDDMVDPAIWPQIQAAGFPVERFLDGYLLRVSSGFADILDDFPVFSRRRAELKAFFPVDLFRIKEEPPAIRR